MTAQEFIEALKDPTVKKQASNPQIEENLFRQAVALLIVPVMKVSGYATSNLELIIMDRMNYANNIKFKIPLSFSGVEYFSVTKNQVFPQAKYPHFKKHVANWNTCSSIAKMLTYSGYDVSMFYVDKETNLNAMLDVQRIPDFRPDLFNPTSPPDVFWIMDTAQFLTLFGFEA